MLYTVVARIGIHGMVLHSLPSRSTSRPLPLGHTGNVPSCHPPADCDSCWGVCTHGRTPVAHRVRHGLAAPCRRRAPLLALVPLARQLGVPLEVGLLVGGGEHCQDREASAAGDGTSPFGAFGHHMH